MLNRFALSLDMSLLNHYQVSCRIQEGDIVSGSNNEQFARIFSMPPAMVPYVDLVVSEQEKELVLQMEGQSLSKDQIAEFMGMGLDETAHLLKEMTKREVLIRSIQGTQVRYAAGRFYANMDYWTAYETGSWSCLPKWTRNAVYEWQLQAFIKLHTPSFEKIAQDPDVWLQMKNRDVLLLDEALELVAAAEYVCVLPCPCKTTLQPGSPVIEGSMRLGARAKETLEIGQGRGLTASEAKAHLLMLDRMGLVHTGPHFWREHDPDLEWVSHGNCNIAYSFPFQAGLRLGLAKKYPRVHYVAQMEQERCQGCGTCVGRCPFGAVYHDGTTISLHGTSRRSIVLDPAKCFGCGLCATSCPEEAIAMEPL